MEKSDECIVMEKTVKNHKVTVLLAPEDEKWYAFMRCNTCVRHYPVHEIDPTESGSMMFLNAEVSMHASEIAAHDQDGWHDGIGFLLEDEVNDG